MEGHLLPDRCPFKFKLNMDINGHKTSMLKYQRMLPAAVHSLHYDTRRFQSLLTTCRVTPGVL